MSKTKKPKASRVSESMRRLATRLRTARSFASAPTTPRIAIRGAGVSGLTLAGILSYASVEKLLAEQKARAN